MATGEALIFSWRRWLAVRRHRDDLLYVEPQSPWQFAFTASGDGQEWHVSQPQAFWRNFAETDFTTEVLRDQEPRKALNFVARHGDPFGHLDQDQDRISTNRQWPGLQGALMRIAAAWDAPDASGTSRISRDPERFQAACDALYELARPDKAGLPDVEWVAQGAGLVPRARTLKAFMIASAASALKRRIAMRTCRKCGEFFEVHRSDTVYCGGSCQAADSKQRAAMAAAGIPAPKSPHHEPKGSSHHGQRAQADSSRSDHSPRDVARKRRGRKVAAKK
jgi:hypothetical protein